MPATKAAKTAAYLHKEHADTFVKTKKIITITSLNLILIGVGYIDFDQKNNNKKQYTLEIVSFEPNNEPIYVLGK